METSRTVVLIFGDRRSFWSSWEEDISHSGLSPEETLTSSTRGSVGGLYMCTDSASWF